MRVFVIVLLLALAIGFQITIRTRGLNKSYEKGLALLESDVGAAIKAFEPALAVQNYDTLGKASKRKRDFYQRMIELTEVRLARASFPANEAGNALAALKALKETSVLSQIEIADAHQRLMRAAAERGQPAIVAEGMLGDFETHAQFLKNLSANDTLEASALDLLYALQASAAKVDRFPIAQRTTRVEAKSSLDAGFQRLGLPIPSDGEVALVDANTDMEYWDPGGAEAAFSAAAGHVDAFLAAWKPPQPPTDLARLRAVAVHNSGMTRFAYSYLTQLRSRDGRWEMFFLPSHTVVPGVSPEELRSSYMQGLLGRFGDAILKARFIDSKDPLRTQIPMSSHWAMAIARARFESNPQGAMQELQGYRQYRRDDPDAQNSPGALPPRIVFFY